MNGKLNTPIYDDFTVLDLNDERKSGISPAAFTTKLYNPDGDESTLLVSITEIGNGAYQASFTPNVVGLWLLEIYHSTYFPQGKSNNYQVYNNDIDDIDGINNSLSEIETKIVKNSINFNEEEIYLTCIANYKKKKQIESYRLQQCQYAYLHRAEMPTPE